MQDTSGVNGEYIYVGLNNGEDTPRLKGEFVTLTFKIPSDAQVGDSYNVEVDKKQSMLAVGVDSTVNYNTVSGQITVKEATECTHSFGSDVIISKRGYLTNGYSYKECTTCGVIESQFTPATEFNVYTYLGTSICYTGKPSGIAPMYKVNKEALNALKEAVPNCKIDAGIEVYKNGEIYDEEIFFGDGATYQLVEDTLFIKVENVSSYDEFTFKAYVRISNDSTSERRTEYQTATVRGSEEISICDVVKCLDLKEYSKEDRTYLQNVLDGFAD